MDNTKLREVFEEELKVLETEMDRRSALVWKEIFQLRNTVENLTKQD